MPVIVGVPRSGTTLLRMMIDAHPAVAIPPETGFLPALADLDPAQDASREAWQIITGFHTWPDFHLDGSALRDTLDRLSPASPAAAARAFYRLYAERFGKSQWGDKTPTYGAALPKIASLLPEARFIHIIRDGRDVTLSVRGLWFRPGDSVEACAGDWAARLAQTRALASRVASYLEIRYEALVEFPEQTLREVCRFLDLTFDSQMLEYHVRAPARLDEHQVRYAADGRQLVSKGERLRNQQLVMAPPRPDRIGRWKSEMTQDEVMRFEAVAGEWLDRLGYAVRSRAV
jgi:Sulfotransferase family